MLDCNKHSRENFVEVLPVQKAAGKVRRCGKTATFRTVADGVVRGLCEFHGRHQLENAKAGALTPWPTRIEA